MAEADARSVVIEPLDPSHDRSTFACGQLTLDDHLRRFAGQNQRLGISRTFVARLPDDPRVVGYHTIAAGAVRVADLPEEYRRRLPRHPVPVAHLGRLAVDRTWHGRRLGERLLIDALTRIARIADGLGIHAVEVLAIDETARGFYRRYGFVELRDDPRHLYLPMRTVQRLGL